MYLVFAGVTSTTGLLVNPSNNKKDNVNTNCKNEYTQVFFKYFAVCFILKGLIKLYKKNHTNEILPITLGW